MHLLSEDFRNQFLPINLLLIDRLITGDFCGLPKSQILCFVAGTDGFQIFHPPGLCHAMKKIIALAILQQYQATACQKRLALMMALVRAHLTLMASKVKT
jgi:hypothetical protein